MKKLVMVKRETMTMKMKGWYEAVMKKVMYWPEDDEENRELEQKSKVKVESKKMKRRKMIGAD